MFNILPSLPSIPNLLRGLGGAPAVPSMEMDMVLSVSGANGTVLTTAIVTSGTFGTALGTPAYIGFGSPSSLTLTKVEAAAATPLPVPLRVGATLFDGTTNKAIAFDCNNPTPPDPNDPQNTWEGIRWPAGPVMTDLLLVAYVKFGNENTDPAVVSINNDWLEVAGDAGFGIPQQVQTPGAVPNLLHGHSDADLGNSIAIADRTRIYELHHFFDDTNLVSQQLLLDGNTVVGTSDSVLAGPHGNISRVDLKNYLYNRIGIVTFYVLGAKWTGSPAFPGRTVTVPPVTILGLEQTGNDELTLGFTSVCTRFKIERSSNAGGAWTTLETNIKIKTNITSKEYVDTTVADASTYRYRVTARIGALESTTASSADVTVSNEDEPAAEDNFDAYSDAEDLDDTAAWVKESGTISVKKVSTEGSVYPGENVVGIYRHTTAPAGGNQRVEVTIGAAGAGGSFDMCGGAVRVQTGAATCYGVVFSAGDLYLLSCNAGTVATVNSDTGMTLEAGDRIAIEASGAGAATRLKVQVDTGGGWVDKWVDQNPAADISGGSFGLMTWLLSGQNNQTTNWVAFNLP